MKSRYSTTKLLGFARNAVLLTLIAFLYLNAKPVQAIPPGALPPGTTFENASALGLTSSYNVTSSSTVSTSLNGVKLETNDRDGYMFNFYLENPSKVTFYFDTQQPLDTITSQERGFQILRLYDSKRTNLTINSPNLNCSLTTSYCKSTLSKVLPPGGYYLKVDFYRYHRYYSSSYSGWLTWNIDPQTGITLIGSSPYSALLWFNQEDIYGQIPPVLKLGSTSIHWYKVNLTADQRYTLRLWGSAYTDLNVYVYSETSVSRPIASGVMKTYPEYLTINVPSRVSYIYIKVENTGYDKAEYSMLLTR